MICFQACAGVAPPGAVQGPLTVMSWRAMLTRLGRDEQTDRIDFRNENIPTK